MLDFDRLNDPEWQAKVRAERLREEEAREALERRHRQALDICLDAFESLSESERSLVRNCRMRLNSYLMLSAAQAKWLLDIEKRVVSTADKEGI